MYGRYVKLCMYLDLSTFHLEIERNWDNHEIHSLILCLNAPDHVLRHVLPYMQQNRPWSRGHSTFHVCWKYRTWIEMILWSAPAYPSCLAYVSFCTLSGLHSLVVMKQIRRESRINWTYKGLHNPGQPIESTLQYHQNLSSTEVGHHLNSCSKLSYKGSMRLNDEMPSIFQFIYVSGAVAHPWLYTGARRDYDLKCCYSSSRRQSKLPIPWSGDIFGSFPTFCPKDMTRGLMRGSEEPKLGPQVC